MRESMPRQVDKKSGVPKEERGVWASQGKDRGLEFSRRRKGQMSFFFFFFTFHSLSHIKCFFFKPWTDDYSPVHFSSVAQLCPTLCNPMDFNSLGSSVHGVLQARILEWVAISYSRGSSLPRDWTHVSCTGRWILLPLSHLGKPQLSM